MWLEHSFLGILKVRRACHLSWSHTFQGEKTLWIPLKVPSGPGSFVGHVPKSLSAGRDDGWCVNFFTKRHLPSPAYSLGVFGSGDVMWRWVSLPTKWPEMTGGYIHKSSCQLSAAAVALPDLAARFRKSSCLWKVTYGYLWPMSVCGFKIEMSWYQMATDERNQQIEIDAS